MPIILVVDDSKLDRHYMGRLLEKDIDWLIEYAENGVEALDLMRCATPDAVVTDMQMPEMDGLEFVAAVRDEFSRVPVILVTGQGSEDLASRALRFGAASYVPKSQLSDGLLETVEQVLALATVNRNQTKLMQYSTNVEHAFTLSNDPATFAIFIEFVQEMMQQMQFCSAVRLRHIAVALEEALLNAMYHGNLELPVEELPGVRQHLHAERQSPLVDVRRTEPSYRDRAIRASFRITPDRAQFVVADEGSGFDVASVPLPAAPQNMSGKMGRGLVLIQNFMDEVEFNEAGTEIRMTLKRGAATDADADAEDAAAAPHQPLS